MKMAISSQLPSLELLKLVLAYALSACILLLAEARGSDKYDPRRVGGGKESAGQ